jgi:hypothetical protein
MKVLEREADRKNVVCFKPIIGDAEKIDLKEDCPKTSAHFVFGAEECCGSRP